MTSLNGIAASALAGLTTSQTALRTVSDNISNVDTPGYVRKVVDQQSNGINGGVSVIAVRLVADRFLQAASLNAAGAAGQAGAVSDLMDQAQALFGDPSSDTSFFANLDQVFGAFSTLTSQPATNAARSGALASVSAFFNNAQVIGNGFSSLSSQADSRITDDVATANTLMSQIDKLNQEISRTVVSSGDPTGSQNQQSQLINQLGQLMNIQVSARQPAGVTLRSSDGTVLVGDGAAVLSYDASGPIGEMSITPPGGQPQSLGSRLTSGEIKGLLDLKNTELPAMTSQLAELTSKTADALNNVSNAYSSVPAPTQLSGRNTQLDLPTALSGFTGVTTVAIVDPNGVMQQQVAIDFGAGTMSLNGGPPAGFAPGSFLATLNAQLGASGTASYTNGVLSIAATGGNGVAVADDPTTPSLKAGRGFSAFFGLNDLVRSSRVTNYNTGLASTDTSPFTGTITMRLTDGSGGWLRDVPVTVPAGTIGNVVTALNASSVGVYGAFSLDANGQMSFQPNPGSGVSLSITSDSTTAPPNAVSMSNLFGIGVAARTARTGTFAIRSDIAGNSALLPMAKLDLTAAAGVSALAPGDNRGADALGQAGQSLVRFDAAGATGATNQTLSDYAAGLSGSIARKAAAADQAKTSAQAVSTEADARRSSVEGVNLDQELVQLTTYQQAYNASARMLQAVKDMYDTLLQMTN